MTNSAIEIVVTQFTKSNTMESYIPLPMILNDLYHWSILVAYNIDNLNTWLVVALMCMGNRINLVCSCIQLVGRYVVLIEFVIRMKLSQFPGDQWHKQWIYLTLLVHVDETNVNVFTTSLQLATMLVVLWRRTLTLHQSEIRIYLGLPLCHSTD